MAEYRNTHSAIGYTFRYYATQMHSNKEIKLLAINDVAPTVENIRNGSYPYTVDVYMVTRKYPTAETQSWWTGFKPAGAAVGTGCGIRAAVFDGGVNECNGRGEIVRRAGGR